MLTGSLWCACAPHPSPNGNMKLIVLACLAAVALARPQENLSDSEREDLRNRDKFAKIDFFEDEQTSDGGSRTSFKASNGLERQEEIKLQEVRVINKDGEEEVRLVPFYRGSFKFPNDDGSFTTRRYYTDETGIHFEGDDLPVSVSNPYGFGF